MKQSLLFGKLLCNTYAACGATEPMERYYASMFASFYDKTDSQPGCVFVNAIARGNRTVPRKLLHHYHDAANPRCPSRLAKDLAVLADCFFQDAVRCFALRQVLETFMTKIPAADAEDLCHILCSADLVQMWTCLTWYAICGDYYGTASY